MGLSFGSAAAAEALVERNYSAGAGEVVADLRNLRTEETLLGGEHFEIGCLARGVEKEVVGVFHALLEVLHLEAQSLGLLKALGVDRQGVADLGRSGHEGVLEGVHGLLLLGLGGLKARDVLAAGEERSHERAGELIEPSAGILDHRAEKVGEAAVHGDCESGIEGGAGGVGGVVGHGEALLGGADVGTGAQGLHRHALLVGGREREFDLRGHLPFLRKGVEQEAHGVVELVEAHLKVGDGGEDVVVLRR